MAVLQAHQRRDGSLGFALPDAVAALYRKAGPAVTFEPVVGADRRPGAGAGDRYSAWVGPELPPDVLVTAELDIHPGTQACGVLVRASDDAEDAYSVRLEPLRNRLVLDRWPRGSTGPSSGRRGVTCRTRWSWSVRWRSRPGGTGSRSTSITASASRWSTGR